MIRIFTLHYMRLLGLAAGLAITILLAAPVSAGDLRLMPRIVVDGDMVTLGDLFGDIGDAGKTIVASAPAPGKRLAITVARIHGMVRDRNLVWLPLRGLKSVTVRRSARRIPAFEIEAVILDALTEQATGDGLRLNLVNRNRVFNVATNAAAGLVVENLSYDARSGRFVASLIAAAGTPDEVRAEYSGRATETVELPALNRLLKRGEIIGDGDIEWLEWPARRTPRDVVTDLADLLGMAAKRSLRPGRPLRERDVQEPVVVAKGSLVSLVYRTSNMVLTAGGRALENGAMGSVIRVLNSKSKVVVEARVDGGNVLSVTLSATSLAMN